MHRIIMKGNSSIAAFLLLTLLNLQAAGKVTVSGYVTDAGTGEELIGANVVLLETGTGTITNHDGYYVLTLDPGFYTVIYSFIGYQSVTKPIRLGEDMVINVDLELAYQNIEEATITAEAKNSNITRVETGTTQLPMQSIKRIPALLGEVDVIKAIQLLPGVSVPSEGSSGFSVRGGNTDQNLILLDEAPVYNASHLLGFFSVFNNDAIKDVKLYKGDIPASSGGRLASLLDIRMKDGNNKKFSATGGIGSISSRLTLEGPVFTENISFLVSGRRTYADIFLPLAREPAVRDNSLYFYDLNGKVNVTVNDRNRFYLSGYSGKDVFSNDFAGMFFGNQALSLRWNHLYSNTFFSNITLIHSRYSYDLGTPKKELPYFNWLSYLDDYGFKADYTWYLAPEHTFRSGLSSFYHVIQPGAISAEDESGNKTESDLESNFALESGAYLSGESRFGKRFAIRYGLRYSLFHNIGESTVFSYDENYRIIDTTFYQKGRFFSSHDGLEPRISINFLLNEHNSVKASYNRTIQYIQMASNSAAGTPLDIWFPVSPNIEPQIANQISAGYFRNFLNNRLESSLELYYKKMINSIDFKDHANLFLNPFLEAELRTGETESYGAEFFLKYEGTKLSGWIGYTLSRTTRYFETINEGIPYPAPFDRPHDLSLVTSYDINGRIVLAANWVYSSGIPITLPTGRFEVMNYILPVYTGRNEFRLPDYHRLDLSITIKGKEKPNKKWHGDWNISLYNAYARKNVWTLNFVQDESDPNVTYAEMTYLFSIIPALTYNFRF
ncbi:MAG: TonB-dependent receptor [Bacteroidales bacterium]|nr:TonB-dependent receptor [Bacteroidales bacterium]